MGPTQRPSTYVGMQEAGRSCCPPRPRRRLCLLKGCEQPFDPSHPQARYCSAACRTEARRWRCWRAGRTYRASAAGQARRREQSQRYRKRLRERRPEPPGEPQKPREGQRPGPDYEDFCCARPGCYELFAPCGRSPLQNFCDSLCRKALRRVRQREGRWRRRLMEPVDAVSTSPPTTRGSPLV